MGYIDLFEIHVLGTEKGLSMAAEGTVILGIDDDSWHVAVLHDAFISQKNMMPLEVGRINI